MKAADIVKTLWTYLPRETDKFSNFFNPDSVSVSGNLVTVLKTAHGLSDNAVISVTGARVLNPISNIDDSGDDVVFTTTNSCDLTTDWQETVNLTSATDPGIDGDYTIVSVINRTNFSIASFPDTGLTDVVFNEARDLSINGLYNITLIDADTFTYELDSAFAGSIDIEPSSMNINTVRVSGSATYAKAQSNYEEQPTGEFWGFVVLGENNLNKDRYVNTDSIMEQGNQNEWNGLIISPFTFYVFVPCNNSIGGMEPRDECEEARPAIYKSVVGAQFDTGFTHDASSGVSPRRDATQAYKTAYYVHAFEFAQQAQVSTSDTLYTGKTAAFRDVKFDMENTAVDNDKVIASAEIQLDD